MVYLVRLDDVAELVIEEETVVRDPSRIKTCEELAESTSPRTASNIIDVGVVSQNLYASH